MSQENIEIVRGALKAASCGDVAAAKDLVGPDLEFHSVFGSVEGSMYGGLAGIERWFADVAEVARKLLICSWHMRSRGQVFEPTRSTTVAESSSRFLAA